MGSVARACVTPWPWSIWAGAAVFLAAPRLFIGSPFDPTHYYLWPVVTAFFVLPLALLLFPGIHVVRHVVRQRVASRFGLDLSRLRRERTRIAFAMLLFVLFAGTPVPLNLFVTLRLHAFGATRDRVAAGTMPRGAVTVLPFRITDTELYDDGVVILYTDGARGSFPGGGRGFLYVPGGVKFPGYNEGNDGWLIGRWYWFTTD